MYTFSQIPEEMRKLILCFNHWEDPKGFQTMNKRERLALLNRYRTYATQPTKENHWIWFGAHAKPTFNPRYNDESVVRLLYNHMVAPVSPQKRVYPNGRVSKSDVNPFRYTVAVGLTIAEKFASRQSATTPEIEAALADIEALYFPDLTDNKSVMADALVKNGHSEFAIAEAFKLSNKEWIAPVA